MSVTKFLIYRTPRMPNNTFGSRRVGEADTSFTIVDLLSKEDCSGNYEFVITTYVVNSRPDPKWAYHDGDIWYDGCNVLTGEKLDNDTAELLVALFNRVGIKPGDNVD